MTTKTIFASAAKTTFALAAVVMMSTMFTSCSKDNNDDNGGSPVPNVEDTKPLPTPKENTVTINGVEKPIVSAVYKVDYKVNYIIELNLSADGKEKVKLIVNKDLHTTGNSIDLTQKEKHHSGYYWVVVYSKSDNDRPIVSYGNPDLKEPVFKNGTLTVSGDPVTGPVSIKLENGLVTGTDKKDYTLVLSYSGKVHKKGEPTPEPKPEPKAKTVTLDGKEKTIVNAEYEKENGNGNNFTLYLYLSSNRAERLEIILNKVLHINGTSIVLKHKEVKHANDEWYWGVDCFNSSGNLFIQTSGRSGDRISVFEEGMLTATGDPETGTISIKLENGRVVGTDGNNYTLTLNYSGSITKKKK